MVTAAMLTSAQAWDALRTVPDPELPVVSVCELGIVREVRTDADTVTVVVTPTYSGCPATAVIAASTAGAGSSSATASQVVNCRGPLKIGIITPLTGGAGFLGQEQLSWTQYAVQRLARGLGLRVQVVRGDTPVEKGPGEGLVVAQKMIADSRLVAVIGPATSGAAASASQALFAAGIAHISPSATRTSLTKGFKMRAGHSTRPGTRSPPSHSVPLLPLRLPVDFGPAAPPLSLQYHRSVLSAAFSSRSAARRSRARSRPPFSAVPAVSWWA